MSTVQFTFLELKTFETTYSFYNTVRDASGKMRKGMKLHCRFPKRRNDTMASANLLTIWFLFFQEKRVVNY